MRILKGSNPLHEEHDHWINITRITEHQPALTMVVGNSRDGAALCDGFALFHKSCLLTGEYFGTFDPVPRFRNIKKRPRQPSYDQRTDMEIDKTGAEADTQQHEKTGDTGGDGSCEEQEWAQDPVQCSLSSEDLAQLSALTHVPTPVVWTCEVKSLRRRADRSGAEYLGRVAEQWAAVSRGDWPSIFAEDAESALDPIAPLRPDLQSLALHASLLDRRVADETEFDCSDPEIRDEVHSRAVSKGRKLAAYLSIQRRLREGWTNHKKLSVKDAEGEGGEAYVQQAQHFLSFVKAHNDNLDKMRMLLLNGEEGGAGTGAMRSLIPGLAAELHPLLCASIGAEVVELHSTPADPNALLQRSQRLSLYVVFRKDARPQQGRLYTEPGAASKEGAMEETAFDFSLTPLHELPASKWGVQHRHPAAQTVDAALLARRVKHDVWLDRKAGTYRPEVEHFQRFLAAHAKHLERFKSLLDSPDDLSKSS